ncbi:histidine protein methyltransferase 1 homolog isoform X2 [Lycorma delicatula]|uniref:histidine protein methyltransferase 1 homolog isoform X2 n=1 Tax=Lycorma delicatula TaxID=130591 RepID=UPI003F5167FE
MYATLYVDKSFFKNSDDGLEWISAKQITPLYEDITLPEAWGLVKFNGLEIYYILPSEIISLSESYKDILAADIITAKYEGGLKVWDCTHHLANYITSNISPVDFKNKTVLDLGCGHGLLGILSIKLGASSVEFQDYNEDVIKIVTIPSVLKNLIPDVSSVPCKFFSGDWLSFSQLNNNRYDIILTSATIYNTNNYKKILKVFKMNLKHNGLILIAAKTYYFGNGGGTRQFEEAVERDGVFQTEVLWTSVEGVQQEILKITYKIK